MATPFVLVCTDTTVTPPAARNDCANNMQYWVDPDSAGLNGPDLTEAQIGELFVAASLVLVLAYIFKQVRKLMGV